MEMFFVSGRTAFGLKVSGIRERKHEIERSSLIPDIHNFILIPDGCKSRVVGCGPDCWSVAHASCQSGHCSCLPGYLPQFTPHPSPRLSMCVSATHNASLQGGDHKSQSGDIKIHYYPDVGILNYWMFAMISIGCIFIAFVGISIYILCQSTCRPEYRVPEYPERRMRSKTQEPPMPSLWT